MDLNVKKKGDIIVVTLPGDTLEANNSQEFSDAVAPLLENNKMVVFDLSKPKFIDSSGCKAILLCYKKLKDKGGMLHLCSVSDVVSALFRLMNLYKIIGIYETGEDAVKAFREMEEKL